MRTLIAILLVCVLIVCVIYYEPPKVPKEKPFLDTTDLIRNTKKNWSKCVNSNDETKKAWEDLKQTWGELTESAEEKRDREIHEALYPNEKDMATERLKDG